MLASTVWFAMLGNVDPFLLARLLSTKFFAVDVSVVDKPSSSGFPNFIAASSISDFNVAEVLAVLSTIFRSTTLSPFRIAGLLLGHQQLNSQLHIYDCISRFTTASYSWRPEIAIVASSSLYYRILS